MWYSEYENLKKVKWKIRRNIPAANRSNRKSGDTTEHWKYKWLFCHPIRAPIGGGDYYWVHMRN